jgi:ParB/RepB/Spo0J family partition protein
MEDKQTMTIEHHCLQMRYAHLRAQNPRTIEKLTASIEQYGQLVPVVIVPDPSVPEAIRQWVLIDGYHRVKALKRLGRDTIEAELWNCNITEALLMVLKNHPTHSRGIFEEALLLHELHTQHSLSQHTLATRLGRDQSWVSRRLSLVEHLPGSVLEVLSEGSLSLWVCVRVLAPMARAIPEHAQRLLPYLLKHTHSTREMYSFYEHYQKSNHQARTRMVDNPELFFKAQKFLEAEKQMAVLKNGPEGTWQLQCHTLTALLSELTLLAPSIFFRQTAEGCRQPLQELNRATGKFDELTKTIRSLTDVDPRTAPDNLLPPPEQEKQP